MRAELGRELAAVVEHARLLVVAAEDGHDHDVLRGELRRQHEAVVVGVGHQQRADQPRRHAPARRPSVLVAAVAVEELDVARAREVLAQEVARAGLQRLAVLHHRLDRERAVGAGETLALGLLALDDGNRHPVFSERRVDVEHPHRLRDGLLARRVRGVAFLPEELGGAEEEARAHLPAHDVRPLVDQQREVAIALHPARERVADDRLGRRPHDQRLLELAARHELAVGTGLEPVMRDDGALLRKAFDVRGLFLQKRQRDEQREVRVLMPRGLDHVVERALHVLPERVAPRADDHAAAHGRALGEIGAGDHLLVPLGVVFGASRLNRGWRDGFLHRALIAQGSAG